MPRFPAYVCVQRALEQRIAQGIYEVGMWLPAERDLATEFMVSRPVVRDALTGLEAAGLISRGRGCRPRVIATGNGHFQGDAADRGTHPALRMIAVALPHQPTYASAQAIVRGIYSAVACRGSHFYVTVFDIHVSHAQGQPNSVNDTLEDDVLKRVLEVNASGLILWHLSGAVTVPALQCLRDANIPVVYVDRHPIDAPCDYVGVDNRGGVRRAVEYLLDAGHRRIAYLTNSERITSVMDREQGYRDAFLARNLAPPEDLLYTTPDSLGVDLSGATDYLLSLSERPTAALVLNDLHAFAFIRELNSRGLHVPDDMSVIGFDDIECYSPHHATLTSVHQPFHEVGERAGELLLQRLASRSDAVISYQHVVLPTSLVIRSSCRPLVPTTERKSSEVMLQV